MTFSESVKTCFSKYVTFSGRARRSEFWWFALFVFGGQIVLSWLDIALWGTTEVAPGSISGSTDTPILSGLFGLATLLPMISVAVRRLHDRNKSGWWYWLALIPLVGFIILIVWWATEGTRGPNSYGPDPLGNDGGGYGGGESYGSSSIPTVPRD